MSLGELFVVVLMSTCVSVVVVGVAALIVLRMIERRCDE